MASSIHTFIAAIADQEAGLAGLTHIETSKQTQLLHLAGDYRGRTTLCYPGGGVEIPGESICVVGIA